jgi:hypothetical protein
VYVHNRDFQHIKFMDLVLLMRGESLTPYPHIHRAAANEDCHLAKTNGVTFAILLTEMTNSHTDTVEINKSLDFLEAIALRICAMEIAAGI